MFHYLPETSNKILDILYHYHYVWGKDASNILRLSPGSGHTYRSFLDLEEKGYIYSKVLEGNTKLYAIKEAGYQYLLDVFDYPVQSELDRDNRLSYISNSYLKHEARVFRIATRFVASAEAKELKLYDRRVVGSHLPSTVRRRRTGDRVRDREIRSESISLSGSHAADDFLLLGGERPTGIFVEMDQASESCRDKRGRPRGKVAQMMEHYLEAYRRSFFRHYIHPDVKPVVLFVLKTPYKGRTRLTNFIDLWAELARKKEQDLARFILLDEFVNVDPLTALYETTEGKRPITILP